MKSPAALGDPIITLISEKCCSRVLPARQVGLSGCFLPLQRCQQNLCTCLYPKLILGGKRGVIPVCIAHYRHSIPYMTCIHGVQLHVFSCACLYLHCGGVAQHSRALSCNLIPHLPPQKPSRWQGNHALFGLEKLTYHYDHYAAAGRKESQSANGQCFDHAFCSYLFSWALFRKGNECTGFLALAQKRKTGTETKRKQYCPEADLQLARLPLMSQGRNLLAVPPHLPHTTFLITLHN